jgi:hypothetical protein
VCGLEVDSRSGQDDLSKGPGARVVFKMKQTINERHLIQIQRSAVIVDFGALKYHVPSIDSI